MSWDEYFECFEMREIHELFTEISLTSSLSFAVSVG